MKKQQQIHLHAYRSDGFIGKYQRLIKDSVIPYQYAVLCDEAPGAEKSHVVQNFINAGKAVRGEDAGDGFEGASSTAMTLTWGDSATFTVHAAEGDTSLIPQNRTWNIRLRGFHKDIAVNVTADAATAYDAATNTTTVTVTAPTSAAITVTVSGETLMHDNADVTDRIEVL